MEKKSGGTHTIMSRSLAQALMDSGMQHLDLGGMVNALGNAQNFGIGPGFTGVLGGMAHQGIYGGGGGFLPGTSGVLPGLFGGTSGTPGVSGFTAEAPSIGVQDFSKRIPGLQQQQSDVFNQQQGLANQLLAQTQGGGPGGQLIAEQTGKNIAGQKAMMASARGANSNPALIARQAAMQSAPMQQQGLNAQAMMALQSQGALGNQQAQMGNQSLQGESVAQGAQAAQNTALTSGSLGAQNINANTQMANAGQRGGILGGILGGGAAGIMGGVFGGGGLFAKGGEVPKKMAVGGPIEPMNIAQYSAPTQIPELNKPQPYHANPMGNMLGGGLGKMLMGGGGNGFFGSAAAGGPEAYLGADAFFEGLGGTSEMMMPAALEAGTMMASQGGQIPFSRALLQGGAVPGEAQTSGDSEENDTVPALLSPGEVVLPRSVTQSPNASAKAAEFVAHLKSTKKRGYQNVVEARKWKGGKVC